MSKERKHSSSSRIDQAGFKDDERSRVRLNKDELLKAPEFIKFISLIEKSGRVVVKNDDYKIVSLNCSEFKSIKPKIGFALLANLYFNTDMGLPGVSITDSEYGRVEFLFVRNEIKAFSASKIIEDPFGRIIHYVDIQGTDEDESGRGLGKLLGKEALKITLSTTDKDVVLLARTQNPREVGVLKGILPEGVRLAPFWDTPKPELIESANWLVQGGIISRNKRSDFQFDGNTSFINWGAYGFKGDGSSWEDMCKFDLDIKWNLSAGIAMQEYAKRHGTSIGADMGEMRKKGHAFIVGAVIKR